VSGVTSRESRAGVPVFSEREGRAFGAHPGVLLSPLYTPAFLPLAALVFVSSHSPLRLLRVQLRICYDSRLYELFSISWNASLVYSTTHLINSLSNQGPHFSPRYEAMADMRVSINLTRGTVPTWVSGHRHIGRIAL